MEDVNNDSNSVDSLGSIPEYANEENTNQDSNRYRTQMDINTMGIEINEIDNENDDDEPLQNETIDTRNEGNFSLKLQETAVTTTAKGTPRNLVKDAKKSEQMVNIPALDELFTPPAEIDSKVLHTMLTS